MQITRAEVIPVELKLRQPVRMAHLPPITAITAIFVRLETRGGESAWGCSVAHPHLTGEEPEEALRLCQECNKAKVDKLAENPKMLKSKDPNAYRQAMPERDHV